MLNNAFLHFLTRMLYHQKNKHIGAILISILVIFLLSAVLFLSTSLQTRVQKTLKGQSDFTISRIQAGNSISIPYHWVDKVGALNGIESVVPRVHGRYFFTPKGKSFLIVGVDFFDEQNNKLLKSIVGTLDLKVFLKQDSMLVGSGVSTFLKQHYFKNTFTFKTPNGTFKEVHIAKVLSSKSNLFTNDMIVMPMHLAQEIFGMMENEITDITFNVPNDAEWDTVIEKIYLMFYDVRVVDKREIQKAYESLYNYKGGLFLVLFLVVIFTFILILYQRYSMVYSTERKEIGILRAIGWSINDILKLKFYENIMIVFVSFFWGVVLAYGYVFFLDAPFLSSIFLGEANLKNHVHFLPVIPFGLLGSIFLFYAVPFLAAVLIPAWKIAVTPPKEAML